MQKKNLFIINTPFHLLTAFILSKNFNEDKNYLALIHPHSYEKWHDNKLMHFLSSVECGYKDIFLLNLWLSSKNKQQSYKQQVNQVKESIGELNIDDIYLGSDIDVQNQLLVGALGKDKFYRYEDGLYSYYNEDRRRSLTHMLFHKMKIQLIKLISGIDGKAYINTSTAGDNRSGIGDFMYKPQLLKRYSPKTFEITNQMIKKAVNEMNNRDLFEPSMKKRSVLYLSQPLVEQNKFTIQDECDRLKQICTSLSNNMELLYKPHPNDSSYKLEFYKKNLPQIQFFNSIAPVELSFAYEENLTAIISYQSTALMFVDKFSNRKIRSISLAKFYRKPLHSAYIDIMKGAGVLFPETIQEVCDLLK